MPLSQYLLLVPLLVIVAFIVNALTTPASSFLLNLLPWLPEWFELRNPALLAVYPKPVLAVTFGVYLLLNGIVAPIVEEMYFRGYLLPRLSRFGRWSPTIELGLFTLYHFWQPYYWLTQFLALLAVVNAVWWKRNIKLGIVTHMLLNLIGGVALAALLLG
jgi:membrane protease YdiL (CAAX protease family)